MTAVFLDLDGTLVDSRPGILEALHAAFHDTGHGHLTEDDLTWLIGPPFHESFRRLGIENVDPVIAAYRDHYDRGAMFTATLYEGVVAAMDAMRKEGRRLYLATAKPHVAARKITAHFDLAPRFHAEFGPELDGTRNWKGDLLSYALTRTGETSERSVMIGDRHHDIAAAAEVGMASVAVKWGYGDAEEWDLADHQAHDPSELPDLVRAILGSSDE